MVASPQQQVTIQRPLYEQEQLHKDFEYHKRKSCGEYVWTSIVQFKISIIFWQTRNWVCKYLNFLIWDYGYTKVYCFRVDLVCLRCE